MFTKLNNLCEVDYGFGESRFAGQFEKPSGGSEKPVSMTDYRQRFREIENSLIYVSKELPASDLPEEQVQDYFERERLQKVAKKALEKLNSFTPEDSMSDEDLAKNLPAINEIFDEYLKSGEKPAGGVAIDASDLGDFDMEEDLENRLEKAATHAVGRVMEAWLTGIKATIGGVEKVLKKIEINSVEDLESEVSKELAKVSDKEFRGAPDDSSWMINDHGFSFIVTKEGANKYDVGVVSIDKEDQMYEDNEGYAKLADSFEERVPSDDIYAELDDEGEGEGEEA